LLRNATSTSRLLLIHALALGLNTLIASWYGMMLVHELGHVAAALATGSRIESVRIPLVGFSQTEISVYHHPLWVVAMGPAVGVAVPLAVWAVVRGLTRRFRDRWTLEPLSRFFAGFCLVANGGYLASAIAQPVGDVEELVLFGVPIWGLTSLGGLGVLAGLAMWNGLAKAFGFRGGLANPAMLNAATVWMALTMASAIAVEAVW
jgi:hypothetical protein